MEKIYTAVLIEPRRHRALQLVLDNFLHRLDKRWGFLIFHGTENKTYLDDIINLHFSDHKDRISFVNMNVPDLSIYNYNAMLMSPKMYSYIPTETFLIFQTDTLLSDIHYNKIYDFIDYDYVGAPWQPHMNIGDVGNGGLSLRKKSKMLEVIAKNPPSPMKNEDIYFSNNSFLKKPSATDAKLFSVETVFSPVSFGVHKPWLYLPRYQIQEIAKHIPRIFELQELN